MSSRTRVGVPSCHDEAAGAVDPTAPVVAIVGAPNVGKSTLFNALTGARRAVGNWPGTSVEVGTGTWLVTDTDGIRVDLTAFDLPGAYSLDAQSPDEQLTRALLLETPASEQPDVVVVVADATTLARSLYVVAQLREQPRRIVVALTMNDVAAGRGITVDTAVLSRAAGVPCVAVDPRSRQVDAVGHAVTAALAAPVPKPRRMQHVPQSGDDAAFALAEERFGWVTSVVEAAVTEPATLPPTWSDRIDRLVTAPVVGPLAFLAAMWVVFQLTTRLAAPIQDLLDRLVSGPVSGTAGAAIEAIGLGASPLHGLVVDGIIAGVGMLLTFVPVMAIMFVLLALLESSGYLARAAVVTDRLMRRIGLPGRAFLPLVVGFGCNVPAIMGTRVLPDARQRLLTALLVPFTSCSARLTVYILVATTFFGDQAGNVVFAMYVVSIALVLVVGLLLRGTLIRHMGREPLVIDLPAYHVPQLRQVATSTWVRLQGFLRTAGGIIVATVVAVWLLSSMPVGGGTFGQVPVEDSAFGALSQAAAPAFAPAGFDDWHTTSALITGFVAKEAVVSSWAQTYATEQPDDIRQPGQLGHELQATFAASSGGHTTPAVLAFLVFLLAYTPCVATLAAQLREIGGRWMAVGIGVQLSVAWVLAVLIFQVGRLL